MPIIVTHPVAGDISFPDGTPDSVINNEMISIDAEFGEEYGIGETLYRAAERGITSTARGLEQAATGEIAPGLSLFGLNDMTDEQKERELRIMLEQNPVSGWSALLLGSLADPVTLPFLWTKLIKTGNIVGQAASRGAGVGFTGGLLEPTYEEYGDSVVMNTMFGTGLGAGLGAVAGKVIQRVTEGPSIKVEGDETGIVVPESVKRDGKLKDEVMQALDDVDLAAVEARVGQSETITKAIDEAQQLATKPVESLPTPPERVFNPVETLVEELTPIAARALPRAEHNTLRASLNAINLQLGKAESILAKRKTVQARERAQQTVTKLEEQRNTIQVKLQESNAGQQAQRQINILASGRTDKLPKYQQARLQELKDQAGVNRIMAQTQAVEEAQKLAEPVENAVQSINQRIAQIVNPVETKPIGPIIGRIPLGLDPRPGVGSTGARPSGRFEATSPDAPGTEATRAAVFGKGQVPQERFTVTSTEGGTVKEPTQITGATEAEVNFHSRLQAASSDQLVRLRDETIYGKVEEGDGFTMGERNRYSWQNVTQGAIAVENRILNDYDDLAEWLAENDENIFKAAELEALMPLIQEAQQRMFDARKILYAFSREDKLDSEEAIRVLQDIQYYNYISNAAYIAQKTKVSNAMTQLRRMKYFINLQEGDLERGKQIDQALFGVTC